MALQAGARLGAYEITGAIGAGGMGEVYRARDSRLNRDIAIKILPQSLADDPHRIARFEREAQVLAALNHPNIAHIYGLEKLDTHDGGGTALVMELVEGPTLADLIEPRAGSRLQAPDSEPVAGASQRDTGQGLTAEARSPKPARLSVPDALAIARQIAAALEAAHAQGIIHRDLKPANIKVREDGTVKVLDFGLAAYRGGPDSSSGAAGDLSNSPTISSPAMTQAGMILGTAAYMSPEQARGKAVDKRADIWAFGCVLYEMLAGRRAFDAEDVSLTLAEVMRGEPDWRALPRGLPHSARTVLARCLQKDPRQRFHDVGDVRLALDGAFETPVETSSVREVRPAGWRRAIPWVAGAIAGSLIAGVVAWRMIPESPVRAVARFTIEPPGDEVLVGAGVAVSPINGEILFVGGARPPQRMFRREPSQLESSPVADTGGAGQPEFSPDGRWIAFGVGPELKKVAAGGGPSSSIHQAPVGRTVGNISWSDDGRIAFGYVGNGDPTYVVPATGGEARELTTLDTASGELDQRTPDWLPGSDAILFTSWRGALETTQIVAQRISSGERRVLASGAHPQFAGGYLMFTRGAALWGAPFDPVRLEFLAEPIPVQEGIAANPNGIAMYAVGSDGSLVYGIGAGAPGGAAPRPRTLVWVDRARREEAINVPPRAYTYARLSPDDTRVALDARDGQSDIWIWNFARETLDRLTVDPGLNRSPAWTPDGTRVAFGAVRDTVEGIYWQAADGSGEPQRINDGTEPAAPLNFSPDGTKLLFFTPPNVGPFNLGLLTLGPPSRSEIILGAAYSEGNGIISPDGRWLAYESNESGTAQIYVRPFPDVNSAREQVSNDGGTRPLWSRDGKELFYYRAPNRIMAVSVIPGSRLVLGRPEVVVEGPYAPANTGRHYDVSSDGQRFLLLRDADASASDSEPHLTVVLNWIEELKRLFPR